MLSTGQPQWVSVSDISYDLHEKPGKPPSMLVSYLCGMVRHREWVCIEHDGYARQKAVQWWQKRAPGLPVPTTVEQALMQADSLRVPIEIAVRPSGRFTEVAGARFT